jgi:cation diffusion facilitator CzcD-associated flavoprotein CzcO
VLDTPNDEGATMTELGPGRHSLASSEATNDVDVVVVGAGLTGLYQLYRTRQDGYSVMLLEAGSGVGGVWYWNRYPGARLDTESYTYGMFVSRELFEGWEWQYEFAEQAENEAYFNYATDALNLRQYIRFDTSVISAVYEEPSATWRVRAEDGSELRCRFLIAATGVFSVPVYPPIAGREDFEGMAYHTGLWPKTPVDFNGKRVAVIGTGASGVQIIPAIAADVQSLTVYQRTPNWCTPLNNKPIGPAMQAELKAGFEALREKLRYGTGTTHEPSGRLTFEDSKEERWAFYETMWKSPGFAKLSSNYTDVLTDKAANAEFCEFLGQKIRGLLRDPAIAEKLIPKDHGFAGKRPPFVTDDYYDTYNRSNVSLVSLEDTPIVRVTRTGVETTAGLREFDIIVWATGFDFGTGPLLRMDIRGRDGLTLREYWADGPATYLGLMSHGFPNLFFPGGPHAGTGNNPRYNGDQSDFIADAMLYADAHEYSTIEVPAADETMWTDMMNTLASKGPFIEESYFYGNNIAGKPRRYLLNSAGRPKMQEMMAELVKRDYEGFMG